MGLWDWLESGHFQSARNFAAKDLNIGQAESCPFWFPSLDQSRPCPVSHTGPHPRDVCPGGCPWDTVALCGLEDPRLHPSLPLRPTHGCTGQSACWPQEHKSLRHQPCGQSPCMTSWGDWRRPQALAWGAAVSMPGREPDAGLRTPGWLYCSHLHFLKDDILNARRNSRKNICNKNSRELWDSKYDLQHESQLLCLLLSIRISVDIHINMEIKVPRV